MTRPLLTACRFGLDTSGLYRLTNAATDLKPATATIARIDLHVFANAGESQAFLSGLRFAQQNAWHAIQGDDDLKSVVALIQFDDEDAADQIWQDHASIHDHGGLQGLERALTWHWLRTWERPRQGERHVGVKVAIPHDGSAPSISVGGSVFRVVDDGFDLVFTTPFKTGMITLRNAIYWDRVTQDARILFEDGQVVLNVDRDDRSDLVKELDAIARHIADAEDKRESLALASWVRQDPGHCRIVEHMQAGWRLFSHDGSTFLHPPEASGRAMRPISHAFLSRLLVGDLVRKPWRVSAGHPIRNFAYEIGNTLGTAVGKPKISRAGRKPGNTQT